MSIFDKVQTLGIPVTATYDALQTFLGGLYVNDFNTFGRTWQVVVQAEPEFRTQPSDINRFYVRNNDGNMVPLGTVSTVSATAGPDVMYRYNRYRAIQILGGPAPGYSSGQASNAMEQCNQCNQSRACIYQQRGRIPRRRWRALLRLRLCLCGLRLRLCWRWTVMTVFDRLKTGWGHLVEDVHPSANNHLPQPGLYHYKREHEGEKNRIHLRLDPDGQGLLMVNASRVFHLNPTAAYMVYMLLEGNPEKMVEKAMHDRYRVSHAQAHADFSQINAQLDQLIRPDGACPICELDLETTAPFSARPSAPYRMDLALTYRCNNACAHCYNARPRNYPEISTEEWKQILDRLWELGIPHVVFTGGEPTMRPDLVELVAHAEKNGQITGLNTNARRLSNPDFLNQLVQAGLDHVQITPRITECRHP